jgi:LPS O-antigen subunit length determinant protein (WzzB/FepE family)
MTVPMVEPAEARPARIVPAEARPERAAQPRDGVVDLQAYLEAILSQWRLIVCATVLAMLASAVVTKFGMTRWYRAKAIVRPVTALEVAGRLSGMDGGLGGFGGASGLDYFVMSSQAASPASEYIPVLESFDFTTHLISGHRLQSHLDEGGWSLTGALMSPFAGGGPSDPSWARYHTMSGRFDCQFSVRTGNLTLYYQDKDRAMAQKILSFYLSDLRELLRAEQVRDSSEAIESLRAQIKDTADNFLQTQLYSLLARQIQQQKLAEVEADFAFKVLQAPTTPDKPYSPQPRLDALLTGLITLIVVTAAVGWRRFMSPTPMPRRRPHP